MGYSKQVLDYYYYAVEKAGGVTLLVISPLNTGLHKLEDELADLRSRGFIASSLASLQPDEVKNNCDLELVLASAEKSLSMF